MRWLREAARKRGEKSMGQRLAAELLEAAEGRGGAVKKREEVHRMAEAHKAVRHFKISKCPELPQSNGIATSASVRTLMPARPRPPNASFSTPASRTRWARSTTV